MFTTEQNLLRNKLSTWKFDNVRVIAESILINEEKEWIISWWLSEVKWIWPGSLKLLSDKWIKTTSQLRAAWEEIKQIIKNPLALKWILNFLNN